MSIKFGNLDISKIYLGTAEVSKIYFGTSEIYSSGPIITIDPVLNNNSWDTIKSVSEAGDASNYWAVGDQKTDVGTDGATRTFRIVDMSGLYSKHIVFEQTATENDTKAWKTYTGTGSIYSASTIKSFINNTVVGRYSTALQDSLTDTTVKVAHEGQSTTIDDVTAKLFLAALKELITSAGWSMTEENDVLTTFQYYVSHSTDTARKKYLLDASSSSAVPYWLRSPSKTNSKYAIIMGSDGYGDSKDMTIAYRFAPCFSF